MTKHAYTAQCKCPELASLTCHCALRATTVRQQPEMARGRSGRSQSCDALSEQRVWQTPHSVDLIAAGRLLSHAPFSLARSLPGDNQQRSRHREKMAGIMKFFKPTEGSGGCKKAEPGAVGNATREVFSPVGNTQGVQRVPARQGPDNDSDVEIVGDEVSYRLMPGTSSEF
jgi:hypothetical protein